MLQRARGRVSRGYQGEGAARPRRSAPSPSQGYPDYRPAAALVHQGFLEHPPRALVHLLRGVVARWPAMGELRDRLARCNVPALIVAGADDAGALEPSRTLAATLSHAELVVISDAGHLVNLEQPAEFNTTLLAWLAGTGV